MKITFFDTKEYDRSAFEEARPEDMEFKFFETRLTADSVELAKGADAVCVFVNDEVSAPVIDRLCELGVKAVALRCAGYNNVDVKHCFGKLHVFHVPAYSPYAVAEHAMAMLLTSIRRIHKAYIRTRDFNFSLNNLTGFDLHGKTVGVVGTGKIGRIFISICRGFGMKVLAYDKFPSPEYDGAEDVTYVTLDELLAKSDIISLHCPLTEDTLHLVNAESIQKMKKGVVLVNTSRGALIDAEALLAGIKDRRIGAACLDVYEEEADIFFQDYSGHILSDDVLARLISMPNVIVTSHQAFLTKEALKNIADTTIENLREFEKSGMSDNELCYQCGKVEQCRHKRNKKCF